VGRTFGGELASHQSIQRDECEERRHDDYALNGVDGLCGVEECDGAVDCGLDVVVLEVIAFAGHGRCKVEDICHAMEGSIESTCAGEVGHDDKLDVGGV
jgi:hypothetical protein